jgi:hypothetical protein
MNVTPNNIPVTYENLEQTYPGWERGTYRNFPKVQFYRKKNDSNLRWTAPNTNEELKGIEVEDTSLPEGWKKYEHKNNEMFVYFKNPDGELTFNRPSFDNEPINNTLNNNNSSVATNGFNTIKTKLANVQATLNQMKQTLNTATAQKGGRVHRRHRHTVKRRTTKKYRAYSRRNKH